MTNFNLESEYSIEKHQKNKLKQIRLGLPKTKYNFDGFILDSFGFHHLNFFYDIMIENSIEQVFKNEWNYRPQFVAEEFFEDPRLHHIIMFVNEVTCVDNFNFRFMDGKIKVPSKDVLNYISKEIRRRNINEREELILNERYGEI